MKAKSLLAAMMAAALSFNFVSCSDDDDPIPGGGSGADGKTIIVNVEEPGTFESEYDNIISHYDEGSELTNLVVKGKLNREDLQNLNAALSLGIYKKWADTVYLDMSEIQIVESTYNGQSYRANHLYGNMNWSAFVISKFPKNIEVIEDDIYFGKVMDISNLLSEKLEEIGDGTFSSVGDQMTPTEIVFPKSLKRIGENAFSHNPSITKITTQGNIQIESGAFNSCESLEEVELNGIETINENTFMRCLNGKDRKMTVSIPDVKYIKEEAFSHNAYVSESIGELEVKNIENVIEIGEDAFANIPNLKIDLASAVNLKKIGDSAFWLFGGDEFTFPENVEEIVRPFSGISVIHMLAKTPPTCQFLSCDTLYVPKGCKDTYMKDAKNGGINGDITLACGLECNVVLEE